VNGGNEKCVHNFRWKFSGEKSVGISRRIWENNIKMNPRERGFECVYYIHLDRDHRPLANTVMKF
jgi:hypothetical protein